MFSNLKLRSKMILGFSVALIIIAVGLVFGIIGLLSNIKALDDFSELADELTLAQEINEDVLNSRVAYKQFMTAGNEIEDAEGYTPVAKFDYSFDKMLGNVKKLSEDLGQSNNAYQTRDQLRIIERELYIYKNNFEMIQQLDREMLEYYQSIASKGYSMLDHLGAIKVAAYADGEEDIHYHVANSLEYLLTARLRASKYFDFHYQEEYDAYLEFYTLYKQEVLKMKQLPSASRYTNDVTAVLDNVDLYQEEMLILYEGVVDQDELEEKLDEIGPIISQLSDEVTKYIISERQAFQDNMISSDRQWVMGMILVAAIALVVFIVIAYFLVRLVVTPMMSLTTAFEEISEGEIDTSFRLADKSNDEVGVMSRAFNKFMLKLASMIEDIQYQSAIKTGQNDIFELAKDQDELSLLCHDILQYVVKRVDGLVGRLYLYDETNENFRSITSYGVDVKEDGMVINPMEGIVGNTILTKKLTLMPKIPEDYLTVKTGLGKTKPSEIIILPCLYGDEVNCVIEIGHIQDFTEKELTLLEDLAEMIGNIIHSTMLRENMKILLEKTLQQSEELQMQQEELRQSNEELEEQTRALKESEQQLQTQQEELRVSNEELEERSKELEHQRHILDEKNKAIMESQDEILEKAYALEQTNRYKSEFLANMSHELRTPLNSILVLSQLLGTRDNSKPLTAKESEFAKTIHTSGTDLLTLINGVLDLSKVEAGRLEIIAEEVIIEELVGEYNRLFLPVAEVKGIDFKTHISESVVNKISTDRLRMSQIIKNLISNAIKFTHDGHVELKVRKPSMHECEYTGLNAEDYIAFAISDTGIGIEPDKKDVIFEAFRQEDGTTSRTYGGTGLGLTISLELSKLLGGDIVLESEVGSGSQFVLIIPIDQNSVEAVKTEVMLSSPPLEESVVADEVPISSVPTVSIASDGVLDGLEASSDGTNLLIIEDDQTFADILAGLAEEKGYTAVIARNGMEGLQKAKVLLPSAIILDMGLPDMDGVEVANRLNGDSATKDIPIHIISGRENVDEADLPKSIIGFLKKPVDIKTIYKTLAKIEALNQRGLKKLLVVGYCGGESFENFTNLGQVEVVKVETGEVALEAIQQDNFGCIVLDTKLQDMTGIDFIMASQELVEDKIPVVIYTEEDINFDDYDNINQYAESVIIKSEKSRERLTDEVSLFLHDMTKTIKKYEGNDSKRSKATMKQVIEEGNNLKGKRVLLVDDDERNVFALLHALEQFGLEVVIAKDGYNAIEKYEKEAKLDIILMDIMMPKMDGYEAIKRIRDLEQSVHVPIIALTAKAMAEDRERCIKAGANDYLTKPIDIEKLLSLMKVWMA